MPPSSAPYTDLGRCFCARRWASATVSNHSPIGRVLCRDVYVHGCSRGSRDRGDSGWAATRPHICLLRDEYSYGNGAGGAGKSESAASGHPPASLVTLRLPLAFSLLFVLIDVALLLVLLGTANTSAGLTKAWGYAVFAFALVGVYLFADAMSAVTGGNPLPLGKAILR